MNKWIKRLIVACAAGVIVIGVALSVAAYLLRGTPSWYRLKTLSAAERADLVNRTTQKVADAVSWAAQVEADHARAQHGNAPATAQAGTKTVSAGEDELNTYFERWGATAPAHFTDKLAKFVTDGRVVLLKDRLVIAGQSTQYGTVLSAQFEPKVDDQRMLRMKFDGFFAGRVPLPQAAFADKLAQLRPVLMKDLEQYQAAAELDHRNTANAAAVKAAAARLLLATLDDQPTDPVVFLPYSVENTKRFVPVRLTNVDVADGRITLALEPFTDAELADVMDHLLAPYAPPTPAVAAAEK